MLALRKVGKVLLGAWSLAFLAKVIFDWLLGLEGWALTAPVLIAAAVGGLLGFSDAREVEPMEPADKRDTILGWGALVGAVATIGCLLIQMPWGLVTAVVVGATTVFTLHRVAKTPLRDCSSEHDGSTS
jgi:hypothetical protein